MIYVSARVDYAVRALLIISSSTEGASAASIAEIEQVSQAYMARALIEMRRAGILVRMKSGYGLARSAADVTLAEVFQAVGESILDVNVDTGSDRGHSEAYMTVRQFWGTMRENVSTLLHQTTLQDLRQNYPTLRSTEAATDGPAA